MKIVVVVAAVVVPLLNGVTNQVTNRWMGRGQMIKVAFGLFIVHIFWRLKFVMRVIVHFVSLNYPIVHLFNSLILVKIVFSMRIVICEVSFHDSYF